MSEIGYNVLAIFGGLILVAYSVVGTVGGEQAGLYQSVLLSIGLVVMVTLAFHLGMLWERNDGTFPG
ncbi:hypothetical protein [Haloarcula laminariae]|uniref:hypothetical protein n=1 Tax=Haloarcula laminariae TaxID=2961577 RepID=UPI0021CAD354|nr:hypothetical protein [Halomicroarcula laminariae]